MHNHFLKKLEPLKYAYECPKCGAKRNGATEPNKWTYVVEYECSRSLVIIQTGIEFKGEWKGECSKALKQL